MRSWPKLELLGRPQLENGSEDGIVPISHRAIAFVEGAHGEENHDMSHRPRAS